MEFNEFKFPWFDRRVWAVGGCLFLALATTFVGVRTCRNYAEPSREFDWDSRGMSDFYTLYYYSKALGDGVNPYSSEVVEKPQYILPRNSAPFSPFVFLPYQPLTRLPLKTAAVVFFTVSWLLLGLLAQCCLRMSRIRFDWVLWLWVFGLLVFSRPGHVTLFTGYFTIKIALGVVVALHFSRSNPWLSGIGFLFAAVKPTYAIPLTLLMLARKDFKAVAIGVGLTFVFSAACFGWLAWHSSINSVIEGVESGQDAFYEDETEAPANTWTRVDVAGMVAIAMNRVPGTIEYLGTMLLLLVIPCIAIWRATESDQDHGAGGVTAAIVVLSLLVSVYHHSYDCIIVAVSMIGLLLNSRHLFPIMPRSVSILVGILLSIPMLNYASTRAARDRFGFEQSDTLWQFITMVNGISLTLALMVLVYCTFNSKTAIQSKSNSA